MNNFYIEVDVVDKGKYSDINIGFSRKCSDKDGPLGYFDGSIGYLSCWKKIVHNGRTVKEVEKLVTGDTIGCGINRITIDTQSYLCVYFTKNGEKLDISRYLEDGDYFPTIQMNDGGKLRPNMGESPFRFKPKGMLIFI